MTIKNVQKLTQFLIFLTELREDELKNNKLNIPQTKKIHSQINDEYPFVFVGDEACPLQTNLMKSLLKKKIN